MNYLKLLFDLYLLKSNTKRSPGQIRKMQERKLRKILDEKGLGHVDLHIIFVEKISPDVITGRKKLVIKSIERSQEAG